MEGQELGEDLGANPCHLRFSFVESGAGSYCNGRFAICLKDYTSIEAWILATYAQPDDYAENVRRFHSVR
eukprot:m.31959 g.31959  ORF g.31959 m.31959 type:complete len:70 (-) comp42137_c0_seq1:1569-1778(-)